MSIAGIAGDGGAMGGVRRNFFLIFNVSLVLAFAVAAVASAKWDVFQAGNVILKFDGGTLPDALPRHGLAPIGTFAKIQIATTDGSHPPAFRGGSFEVDRSVAIDAKGLPVCKASQLEARGSKAARKVCGKSIVGTGQGTAEIAFPEQAPIPVTSPLTFFNGGVKGATTTLFVHAFITVPAPAAIVTTVKFTKIHKGRYGLGVVADIPVIAGGSGSVLAAHFTVKRLFTYKGEKRSYLMGGCPDGRLQFRIVKTDFKVEAGEHLSVPSLIGTLVRPCTPKG
jgi:hypothetical protein